MERLSTCPTSPLLQLIPIPPPLPLFAPSPLLMPPVFQRILPELLASANFHGTIGSLPNTKGKTLSNKPFHGCNPFDHNYG
jgi:hypothetical protein